MAPADWKSAVAIPKFSLPYCNIKNHYVGFIQMILFFVSVLLGFCVALPVGITLRNFHGSCLLFAQVVWDNQIIWPWAETTCDYVLWMNVALSMVYGLLMGIFTLFFICPRGTQRVYQRLGFVEQANLKFIFTGMSPVFVVLNSIVLVMVLVSAVILTAGFYKFCSFLEESIQELGMGSMTCMEAQNINWSQFRIIGGATHGVRGGTFHIALTIAIICSWLLVGVWATQLVISCSAVCGRCSCDVAEEKRKPDKQTIIAQRRSRMATPSGTPGGRHTPVPLGQPMPPLQQAPVGHPMGHPMGHPHPYSMGAPPPHHQMAPPHHQMGPAPHHMRQAPPPMGHHPMMAPPSYPGQRGPPGPPLQMQPMGRGPSQSDA